MLNLCPLETYSVDLLISNMVLGLIISGLAKELQGYKEEALGHLG